VYCSCVEYVPHSPLLDFFVSVLHRGFHSYKDSACRPIENSLTAYETAWSAGMKYCECDISLTLDEHIVL
jgi:glycerophosphoryl diester phosphodiesterase